MLRLSPTPAVRGDADLAREKCEYGPLATRRKRLSAACKCVGCVLGPWSDWRVRRLLEIGRAYAGRATPLSAVTAALREAEGAGAEVTRRSSVDVWGIFEGFRAGDAASAARQALSAIAAVRWALGTGGALPPIPASWAWMRSVTAEAHAAPICEPAWRTTDVLALARLVQAGETDVLPILADALQDAGCDDDRILDHCRSAGPHTRGCWVPDLILDTE